MVPNPRCCAADAGGHSRSVLPILKILPWVPQQISAGPALSRSPRRSIPSKTPQRHSYIATRARQGEAENRGDAWRDAAARASGAHHACELSTADRGLTCSGSEKRIGNSLRMRRWMLGDGPVYGTQRLIGRRAGGPAPPSDHKNRASIWFKLSRISQVR
jgi:hypothetical protein